MSVSKLLIVNEQWDGGGHDHLQTALHEMLRTHHEIELVGEVSGWEDAVRLVDTLRPDVALIYIERGREDSAISMGNAIKTQSSSLGIVLVSTSESSELEADAYGWTCVSKSDVAEIDSLVRVVKSAAWGLAPSGQVVGALQDYPSDSSGSATLTAQPEISDGGPHSQEAGGQSIAETSNSSRQSSPPVASNTLDEEISAFPANVIAQRRAALASKGLDSDQELVMELVAREYSNSDIAELLAIDEKSVQEHLDVICYRLGVARNEASGTRDAITRIWLDKS